MRHDPTVVMISVVPHPEGRFKDTANNIFTTKGFVISFVSTLGGDVFLLPPEVVRPHAPINWLQENFASRTCGVCRKVNSPWFEAG
jgi:hypothetical protein